jgi:drug/metabolite transporter (DMT)-like permease
VATQQLYALGFASLLFAGLWLTGGAGVPQASATAWASALVSGVLYYGVAYWLYLSGLRRVPASIAAVSFYLIPVFGVAASFLLLGERLEPVQWVGAAVVVAAVASIMTWTSRPSEAAAPV